MQLTSTLYHARPYIFSITIARLFCLSFRGQRIHFLETLHALAGRVAGEKLPSDEEFTIHNRMVQRLPRDELPPKFTVGGKTNKFSLILDIV